MPSESCVWKWKPFGAPPGSKALTSGSQLVPSGWMLQMPQRMLAAQALRFERAEHDPAVLEHDRDAGAMPRLRWPIFSTFVAVVVHDEQLQARCRIALGRAEAVAVAGEDDLAARQRAGAEVEDAVVEVGLALFRRADSRSTSCAAPVLGVNCWCVSRTILRVLTWIL